MTAQPSNSLGDFAYPASDSSAPATTTTVGSMPLPTGTPVDPASVLTSTSPSTTDESKPEDVASVSRGNGIDGPPPVMPDPAVIETPQDQISSTVPAPVASDSALSATVEDPLPSHETNPLVTPPVEEGHESPLQALAKKLAKLKDELIQDKGEDKPEEVAHEAPSAPEAEVKDDAEKAVEDMTKLSATASPLPDVPAESLDMIAPASDVLPAVPEAQTAPVSDVDNALPDFNTTPPVVDPLSSSTDDTSKKVPTLEQMYPEVVAKPDGDTASTEVPLVDSSVSEVTAPALPASSENSAVDENDHTQVNPQVVESASSNAKYPLSINKIMDIAIERNASDIQVSVGYPVMIRIDGSLIAVNDNVVSPVNAEELIMPVLSEQKKELLEVNREVDLAYSPLQNAEARFRINAYYSKGNLTAAFRLIPSKIRTIEELQLPALYNQIIKLGQGLVLVTGPTGHGKSTTLAAMLQAINLTRSTHMITIEDPIEYVFKPAKAVIDQREMHDDTHSWTVALKSALRQDPDVILVGEMRDYETIASTITLAETGHLVFATLHTNSAAQTVDRIIDVFPENQQAQIRTQLANILEAVIAQRLIPIDGGGRRAVSEIMLGVPAVRNLIREGKTHQIDNVIRTSLDIGMVSLEQSLVKLVREGLITMERAQEFAVHPEEIVRLLKV